MIFSNISACTIIELDKQAMKARNFNEQIMLINKPFSQPEDSNLFEESTELAEQNFDEEQSYDWTKYTASKKANSLFDIFMTQCIFCLVIIIVAIIMNILQPELTDKVAQATKAQLDKPFEFSDEIAEILSKIRGIL